MLALEHRALYRSDSHRQMAEVANRVACPFPLCDNNTRDANANRSSDDDNRQILTYPEHIPISMGSGSRTAKI